MPKAAPPTNVMSMEEFKTKTDGYERVMDRTWYCIGNSSGAAASMEVFWEINTWATSDKALGKKCFFNHTVTRKVGSPKFEPDPLWNGHIIEGKAAGMTPLIALPCCSLKLPAADWLNMTFPTNDSHKEFWTYGMKTPMGYFYFIFALTPDIPDALYEAELKKLGEKHGLTPEVLAKFDKVKWPAGYKPGDAGEESTNTPGKGATLKPDFKAKALVK